MEDMCEDLARATAAAAAAVQHDLAGQTEAAIQQYRTAALLLDRCCARAGPEQRAELLSKVRQYHDRAERLMALRGVMNVTDAQASQAAEERAVQQCYFLFQQALDADDAGLESMAVDLYAQAVELAVSQKGVNADVKDKINKIATRALDRAELLKGINKNVASTSISIPPRKPVIASNRMPLQRGESVQLQLTTGKHTYSDEEKIVLRYTSKINNNTFLPFMDIDLSERFQYAIPFQDRDGLLKLSSKQEKEFDRWVRPDEICRDPKMIVGGHIDCFSIKQTIVSDCSFVASLAVSALYERRFNKKIITNIIYPRNKNKEPVINPFGKYMIKLHLNGVRRKVIIDELLPYSRHGRLLCSFSSNRNEFWVSLLEKAYMKVMGGYDFPGSNSNIDLHALTGWIPERAAIRAKDADFNADALYDTIRTRLERGDVLVTVATGTLTDAEADRTGLVATHAYAVLDVQVANGVKLLKLKNPWSHLRWRGNYSELDTIHWQSQLMNQLNYDPDSAAQYDNGVFWIDYESILHFFDVFYLNWNPLLFKCTYCIHQKWDAGNGPIKDAYNVGENPQFSLHVQGTGAVWILLTRHITLIDDFRDNQEYITLLVYKNDGKRVYYPYDPPPYIDGVRINSPHYLCKVIVGANSADRYTLLVSQYEKSKTIFYTLRAYATCPFTLNKLELYPVRKSVSGQWSGQTAGGCENHSLTHHNNPKFLLTLPESRSSHDILLELKGPKQYQMGIDVRVQSLSDPNVTAPFVNKSSGNYRRAKTPDLHSHPASLAVSEAPDAESARPHPASTDLEVPVAQRTPRSPEVHDDPRRGEGNANPTSSPVHISPAPSTHGSVPDSRRLNSSGSARSSQSARTIVARKHAAEALHARRLLERESAVAELELRAELAAIDAAADSSRSGSVRTTSSLRTVDWVNASESDPPQVTDNLCLNKNEASGQINSTHGCHNSRSLYERPASIHENEAQIVHNDQYVLSNENFAVRQQTPLAPLTPPRSGSLRQTENVIGNHTQADISNEKGGTSEISQLATAIVSLVGKSNSQARIRAPKPWYIELTPFYGKSTEWLAFQRTFEDTRASYTAAENLARLRHALRGEAREAVASLLVSACEPDDVLRALELRFARPEYIVLQELAAVRALPRLNESKDLNMFACKVRNCVSTIRLLNKEEYLHSPELFESLLGKLSPWMRSRWIDFAAEQPNKVKLDLLTDFLTRESERQIKFGLVSHSVLQQSAHSHEPEKKREKIYATSTSSSTAATCVYCKEHHNIKVCNKFKLLSVDDRWRWVRQAKVCFRCLKDDLHQWKSCFRVKRCNTDGCKLRHHVLLHGGTFPSVTKPASTTSMCTSDSTEENVRPPENKSEIPNEILKKDDMTFNNTSVSSSVVVAREPSRRALLKVIPVVVSGPAGAVETYALLDDGSTATLIDSHVSERIGATGPEGRITVNAIKGLSTESKVNFVEFSIRGRYSDEVHIIRNARSIPSLGLSQQTVRREDTTKLKHLADLTEELAYEGATPTVLISSADCFLTYSKAVRKGSRSEPIACLTALGWVLHGVQSSKTNVVEYVDSVVESVNFIDDQNIEILIKDQYKLDSIGIVKNELCTQDERRAQQILESTARRLPTGRFEVGLLWRQDDPKLPNSYPLARRRLELMEKKMSKDPMFSSSYKKNMQDLFDKGFAEKCPTNSSPTNTRWYLPHFGVTNVNKPAKLRIVHDAAATSGGVSLNTSLLSGPDLLQSILGVLYRFREGCVAMTADIREMFPQIKVREDDRDAQRFLWRTEDQNAEVKEYRMSSLIFGATSSPYTALYIKNKNAQEFESQFPAAVHAIVNDHYMDDYIGSIDDPRAAAQLASDIVTVHQKACFIIRDWVSNEPSVLSAIPDELRLQQSSDVKLASSQCSVRTLGLIWNPEHDTLGFQIGLTDEMPTTLTKRKVLSHVMRVYDPLGLLSPIVVRGRILFQQTWKSGVGWDDELPSIEAAKWTSWLEDLSCTRNLHIQRWYLNVITPIECELHMFADASELAYTTVAYWRFNYADGTVKLALIGSKVRVTPLKPVSIPRLELQAALLAARLACTICDEHRIKPRRIQFWTDSMTVLRWLRSDPRTFKAFVGHRVGEISETTNISDWRWVPSALNVADDATRVKSGPLEKNSRWCTGPEFLLEPPESWPSEPSQSERDNDTENPDIEIRGKPLDINCITVDALCAPVFADSTRFSNWIRLLRATAYAYKYVKILKDRVSTKTQNDAFTIRPQSPLSLGREACSVAGPLVSTPESSAQVEPHQLPTSPATQGTTDTNKQPPMNNTCTSLTAEDLRKAESIILRSCQADTFSEEISRVRKDQTIKKGRLAHTSLLLDDEGILRLAGRIKAARGIDYDVKNPIILDGRHWTTRLLVLHMHQNYAHANNETVINEIRQRYWILRLRDTVRSVARKCQICKIRRATPLNPPTGDLPFVRLAHHRRPFTYTGIDYFGPVEVSLLRRRLKRWVALFTCMTTRAVHLDIVHSLSTDSAIMCIRRFISRRGKPSKILSDNATTFVGAKKQLTELYGQEVHDFASNIGIQWEFIPPSAPFMGGAWERLVRNVKTALRVTLHERAPTEEVLHTLLLEAEAIINSRPLTHVSTDQTDPEALTPFHFILGSSSTSTSTLQLDDGVLVGRCQYKKGLRLADHFWNRWLKEYLPTVLPRRNHNEPTSNLRVDDLVIIIDGNLPRGTWPRGRVLAVYPGQDGIVRVADVATAGGTLRRPAKKLLRLPVDPEA